MTTTRLSFLRSMAGSTVVIPIGSSSVEATTDLLVDIRGDGDWPAGFFIESTLK